MADPKAFNDAIRVALREESLEENSATPRKVNMIQEDAIQLTETIRMLGKLLKKEEASKPSRNFNRGSGNNFNCARNRFTREGSPVCNFCNKLGHVERSCWTKFPHLKSGAKERKEFGKLEPAAACRGQSAMISNPLPIVNVANEERNVAQEKYDCYSDDVSRDSSSSELPRITNEPLLCSPASIINGFIDEAPA